MHAAFVTNAVVHQKVLPIIFNRGSRNSDCSYTVQLTEASSYGTFSTEPEVEFVKDNNIKVQHYHIGNQGNCKKEYEVVYTINNAYFIYGGNNHYFESITIRFQKVFVRFQTPNCVYGKCTSVPY